MSRSVVQIKTRDGQSEASVFQPDTGKLSHLDMLTRIATGSALGDVIGYERDRHRRPAGLRTHLIVEFADSVAIRRVIDAVEGVRGVRRIIVRAG